MRLGSSMTLTSWLTAPSQRKIAKRWNDCISNAKNGSNRMNPFAPHKYELIYLAKNPKFFNMGPASASQTTVVPKPVIRILGLQIDTRLKWGGSRQEHSGDNGKANIGVNHNPTVHVEYLIHQGSPLLHSCGAARHDLCLGGLA